jgi:uncharacterized protein (TIGR02302 family)
MARLPFRIHLLKPLAWLVLLWEASWVAFWPLLTFVGLAVALMITSWPAQFSHWPHLILLACIGLLTLGLLVRGISVYRSPRRLHMIHRLEEDSGFEHHPLSAQEEKPDYASDDPDDPAAALWHAHQQQQAEQLWKTKLKAPRGLVAALDRYGLHLLPFLLLIILVPLNYGSLQTNFRANLIPQWPEKLPPQPMNVDVWINPPVYTGQAPFVVDFASGSQQRVTAPVNSVMIIQVQGNTTDASVTVGSQELPFFKATGDALRLKQKLVQNEVFAISNDPEDPNVFVAKIAASISPDKLPLAIFDRKPVATDRHSIQFAYRAEDDYGLAELDLKLTHKADQNLQQWLVGLSDFTAGQIQIKQIEFLNLTKHLWAGEIVELSLLVKDQANQESESAAHQLKLPELEFKHPLAQQLISLRKRFYWHPQDRVIIEAGLVSLSLVSMEQGVSPEIMKHILDVAPLVADPALDPSVVPNRLWELALLIDQSPLRNAEAALRQAEQALKDAIENGASDEEISDLSDKLRKAMEDFMAATAQKNLRDMLKDQNLEISPPGEGSATNNAIEELTRQLETLNKQGKKEEALELLDRMREMLENLAGNDLKMRMDKNQSDGSNRDIVEQLGDVMAEQQSLLNDVFKELQNENQLSGNPDAAIDAALKQERLRRDLEDLIQDTGNTLDSVPEPLAEAEQQMKSAVEALTREQGQQATQNQSDALQALQNSAQAIANQLAEKMGEGATEQAMRGLLPEQNSKNLDPLGRVSSDDEQALGTKVDTDGRQGKKRTESILQELRGRANDPARSAEERAYIKRLLEKF